jgi:hypothetical protein
MTFDEKIDYLHEQLDELDDDTIPHDEFVGRLAVLLQEAADLYDESDIIDDEIDAQIKISRKAIHSLMSHTIH